MTVPIRPPDPRVMKALAAYKKQGLNRLADVAGLSQGTGDAVQSFAMGATEPLDVKGALRAARRGIEAWHGSPHKFDKFSLEKIGTGEGNQAFGDGIYLASQRNTAEWYKDALKRPTFRGEFLADVIKRLHGDRRFDEADALEGIARSLPESKNPKATWDTRTLEQMRREAFDAERAMYTGESPEFDKFLESLTPDDFAKSQHLYRVNIDASPHELLNWDAPLKGQPVEGKIRELLRGKRLSTLDLEDGANVPSDPAQWRGGDAYNALSWVHDSNARASNTLKDAGIPGIEYIDATSRNVDKGTRNYVIFDPERIQILERLAALGIGGEAVRTMLAQAKAAAQPQQSQPPTLPAVTVGR